MTRIKVGTVDRQGVYVNVEVRDTANGPELSVTSDIYRSGHDVGGGQCIDTVRAVATRGRPSGLTHREIHTLVSNWRRWHLNGMKAGCEHQRAAGWDERPIDPSKPLNVFGTHFEGQRSASWNMLTWVRPEEYPEGLLGVPCPDCGYKYGTAWLHEPLPTDIIEWANNFGRNA